MPPLATLTNRKGNDMRQLIAVYALIFCAMGAGFATHKASESPTVRAVYVILERAQ
jgi:hypothetical protein